MTSQANKMHKSKGFLAYIDILGFKNLVKNSSDLSKILTSWDTLISKSGNSKLKYIVFSDTVVIYIMKNSFADFTILAKVTSTLFYNALINGISVRGCISMGNIVEFRTNNGVILAGDALIDAYHYEGKQNWLGIILSPNLLANYYATNLIINKYNGDYIETFPREVVYYKNIPLYIENGKESKSYEGYCVYPRPNISENVSSVDFQKFIDSLELEKIKAPDSLAQLKYQFTIDFIAEVFSYHMRKSFPNQEY